MIDWCSLRAPMFISTRKMFRLKYDDEEKKNLLEGAVRVWILMAQTREARERTHGVQAFVNLWKFRWNEDTVSTLWFVAHLELLRLLLLSAHAWDYQSNLVRLWDCRSNPRRLMRCRGCIYGQWVSKMLVSKTPGTPRHCIDSSGKNL